LFQTMTAAPSTIAQLNWDSCAIYYIFETKQYLPYRPIASGDTLSSQ
jgi:hypothetical protein